jgi:hypothetical protein
MADKVYLKRDAILNETDVKSQDVSVPEWGGLVVVRGMTGRERDEWEATLVTMRGKSMLANMANARAKLVQRTIIDPDTQSLMFTEGDIEALGNKSASALQRVFDVARKLSGLTENDIQELTENFKTAPSDTSTTN